jgi:hypothetical protein
MSAWLTAIRFFIWRVRVCLVGIRMWGVVWSKPRLNLYGFCSPECELDAFYSEMSPADFFYEAWCIE